jgi:hypothetical protein
MTTAAMFWLYSTFLFLGAGGFWLCMGFHPEFVQEKWRTENLYETAWIFSIVFTIIGFIVSMISAAVWV